MVAPNCIVIADIERQSHDRRFNWGPYAMSLDMLESSEILIISFRAAIRTLLELNREASEIPTTEHLSARFSLHVRELFREGINAELCDEESREEALHVLVRLMESIYREELNLQKNRLAS